MSNYTLCKKPLEHITILDTKELHFHKKLKISELSDLAYVDGKLYAISDKGRLHTFSITIKDKKIQALHHLRGMKLKDKHSKNLTKEMRDSEGLYFINDALIISFEGKERVSQYTLNGQFMKNIKLPNALKKHTNYDGNNRGLESVIYSKKYGIITAPERPLYGKKQHTIYAKNHKWKFKSSGSITALEFISKNKLLILTRKFNHFTRRRITTLLQINLKNCKHQECKVKELARLDNYNGCAPDNFEGLSKVKDKTFLMVSDDNHSIFQKTLLVLFEIK